MIKAEKDPGKEGDTDCNGKISGFCAADGHVFACLAVSPKRQFKKDGYK